MELIKNFQLPDGTRFIWHSKSFKETWEPRVQQLSNGYSQRERETVALGLRKLTLQPISRGFEYERIVEWARNHGLFVMPIRAVGMFNGFAHRYVAGEDMYVTAIATHREYAEDPNPEKYLGYPTCCQEFFFRNFPQYIDPVWQWAGGEEQKSRIIEIQANPYANPLLRYWSLRFTPHIPCSPNCEESLKLGSQFGQLMTEEEHEWLFELLSGSIQWSCLHGIAEVVTKYFRIISPSNPSACKYEVFSNKE